MNWDAELWVAAISAVVAVVSLVLTWVVVRRQTQLQFESLKAQMDAEVVAWSHEAIDLVCAAQGLAESRGSHPPDEFRRLAHDLARKLSAVADRGRLFFPNVAPDAHGQDKQAAFQGYRQPILDAVIFAYGQLERLVPDASGPDKEAARFLAQCRRLLVSEAQNAVDPRRRQQMLRRLAIGRMDDKKSAFAFAAELGEAIEARYPGYLIERRDANWVAEREAMAARAAR